MRKDEGTRGGVGRAEAARCGNGVTASSVNMFKNKVDTYIRRAGYT